MGKEAGLGRQWCGFWTAVYRLKLTLTNSQETASYLALSDPTLQAQDASGYSLMPLRATRSDSISRILAT